MSSRWSEIARTRKYAHDITKRSPLLQEIVGGSDHRHIAKPAIVVFDNDEVERGEKRLQKNEKRDMAKDNGHLTKKDQRQLNREANHMSARIAKDKHNAK